MKIIFLTIGSFSKELSGCATLNYYIAYQLSRLGRELGLHKGFLHLFTFGEEEGLEQILIESRLFHVVNIPRRPAETGGTSLLDTWHECSSFISFLQGGAKELLSEENMFICFGFGWLSAFKRNQLTLRTTFILPDNTCSRLIHSCNDGVTKEGMSLRSLALQQYGDMYELLRTNQPYLFLQPALVHQREFSIPGLIYSETMPYFSPAIKPRSKPFENSSGDYKIMHIADLRSAASSAMMKSLLTIADSLASYDGRYTFNLVGNTPKGHDTGDTVKLHNNVFLRYHGRLTNSEISYMSNQNDAYLNYMAYPVGIRTRLLTGLSLGLPCISDCYSSESLPGLVHDYNVVFATSASNCAHQISRVCQDIQLKARLADNGLYYWKANHDPYRQSEMLIRRVQKHFFLSKTPSTTESSNEPV